MFTIQLFLHRSDKNVFTSLCCFITWNGQPEKVFA